MPEADLKIANLVKNHNLAKSISDASWHQFVQWLEYYAKLHGIVCVAVPPHFTSQNCSNCGQKVQKSLSVRTHKCPHCNYIADRDHNAARNILAKGLEILGAIVNSTEEHASCLLRRSCANANGNWGRPESYGRVRPLD